MATFVVLGNSKNGVLIAQYSTANYNTSLLCRSNGGSLDAWNLYSGTDFGFKLGGFVFSTYNSYPKTSTTNPLGKWFRFTVIDTLYKAELFESEPSPQGGTAIETLMGISDAVFNRVGDWGYYDIGWSNVSFTNLDISTVSVTGITITPSTSTIIPSGTTQLTPTIAPIDATTQTVSYSSDNTNIATVSSTGLVTAVSTGTAAITVTTADGGFTATCQVTVVPPTEYLVTPVLNDNVVITPGTPQTVIAGQSVTFTIVPNENMVINTVTATNGDAITFTAPSSYSITPTSDTSILVTVTTESIWEYNRIREAQSPSIIQVIRLGTEVLTEQNIETLDIDENISPTGAEIAVDTADIVCLFDTESIEDANMSDDAKIKQIYDWYVATFPVGGAITINSGFLLDDEEVLS